MLQTSLLLMKSLNKTETPIFLSVVCSLFPKAIVLMFIKLVPVCLLIEYSSKYMAASRAVSVCSYANDAGCKFCQSCGYQSLQEDKERYDNYVTERHLSYLDSLIGNPAYSKKKTALQQKFGNFLLTLGKKVL